MIRDAVISPDRRYRYSLIRNWDALAKEIVFIGINPSTADANIDDHTVTKLIEMTRRYGYGGFKLLNLYAFRSTVCSELKKEKDPFGERNWEFLEKYVGKLKTIVFMWGKNDKDFGNVRERLIKLYPNALCFGHNEDGSPKHPLMLSYSTKLIRYDSNDLR